MKIGLIGDYDESVTAHRAIERALRDVPHEWIATGTIASDARVSGFDGLWAVPATPYRSQSGALTAIRFAREHDLPFLGTCGGFQHAVLEYARNVLGWSDAVHGEESSEGRAVIAELQCSLVEVTDEIELLPGTRIAAAYGTTAIREGYHCRYGVAPDFESLLESGPLRVTARDRDGAVRAVELDGHRFFAGTLFQPERAALADRPAPLVKAFLDACRR